MKLLLFDIDGTLLISKGLGREAKSRAIREVYDVSVDVHNHPFGGKTDWQILNEVLVPQGITSAHIGERMDDYQQVFSRHMRSLAPEYPATPLEGAHDLIAMLRARTDLLLGLVTGNTHATAPIKLQSAGFDPSWFKVGAYGNESHNRNDLPHLALQRAITLTGKTILPHDVIVIGDTVADVDCARALGAVAVVVLTGFEDKQTLLDSKPDYVLNTLQEFMIEVGI